MALCDITIIRDDLGEMRIPHLVKHEVGQDDDTSVTETYDEDISEEGTSTKKFNISGVIVSGEGDNITESQLYAFTTNMPGGYQIVAIDHQIKTKYTYDKVMRKSWKNSRDGKKRPTRDLEFQGALLKVEDI